MPERSRGQEWSDYQLLVLAELERSDERHNRADDRLNKLDVEIAKLDTKAALIAAIAGILTSAIVTGLAGLIFQLFKQAPKP
jgi:hypothetical protein